MQMFLSPIVCISLRSRVKVTRCSQQLGYGIIEETYSRAARYSPSRHIVKLRDLQCHRNALKMQNLEHCL